MPDFPIIDAHVHFWDPDIVRLTWIDGLPLLNKKMLPPQFAEHTAAIDIEGLVYVESGVEPQFALLEARWAALELALAEPRIKAIVAAAPLEFGTKSRSYFRALKEMSPLIKGVRRITQGEPDPAFCLRPDFIDGARLAADFGFSIDLCINFRQLEQTIELVKLCPGANFILDHIGKPNIKEQALEPWRAQMSELAELPNVVCKISGVLTEANMDWTPPDIDPFLTHALKVFGEDRVLFGGDWPVVLPTASYSEWVVTLDAFTVLKPENVRRKLWAENARRAYRIA